MKRYEEIPIDMTRYGEEVGVVTTAGAGETQREELIATLNRHE